MTKDSISKWARFRRGSLVVMLVSYITLIGVFAIEELDSRSEMMRVLMAEEVRLSSDGLRGDELAKIRVLRKRLTALSIAGSRSHWPGTLIQIEDEHLGGMPHHAPPKAVTMKDHLSLISNILLIPLHQESSSGQVFAILVIVAAIGGALIRLSLDSNWEFEWSVVVGGLLRGIGGGAVCYLVINGGKMPLTILDANSAGNPSTASFLGFLSGMFADQLFKFLRDLFQRLLDRLLPGDTEDSRGQTK
jgi:hypothetical protein